MSEPDSIEEPVIGIIAEVVGADPAEITGDTALAALGWDSMNSIEALVRMESTFAVSLDLRSFHAVYTVAEMVALVEKLQAGAPRHP
ncbi:acyl carrier protein [Streptomyces lushanensis]|uniref:acyl carrier protein n=1 Tax=Streptomyces lushanensis TaxID=1434255 RepID=UPI00082E2897|nr:acyl carrier protein [Streptomyces lushanensis]